MATAVAIDTRDAILDAAVATLIRYGEAKSSLGDVAREAGVSRQTVYRYFRSKDELIEAALLREEAAFAGAVVEAAAPHADLRDALEAGIATSLRLAREHPLFDRLLRADPVDLLPWLTTDRGPILRAARPVMEAEVAKRWPVGDTARVRAFADAVVRLLVSYAVNPPDTPVDEIAATLADVLVHGLDPRSPHARRSAR
ncbi:MAG: TetR family transcriptional regulator [Acidimicrobiales bacterium]